MYQYLLWGELSLSSYFIEHYSKVKLPIATGSEKGLRRAQLGAVHAVAAHFTLSETPAVVAMPTGSGKTTVLMLSTYMLLATRALVITPSVLVRNQIAEQFNTLSTLRSVNAIPDGPETVPSPKVKEVPGVIRDETSWEELRQFDVVVGTPNSLSPTVPTVPTPPEDLFDLVLVDEAHHSRAKTWETLLDAFPGARQVHCTATPFRNDKKQLPGTFAYSYPLSKAYEDGVFGEVRFVPVEPDGADPDAAIAKTVEETLLNDREQGFDHLIMVRTDSRKKANELKAVYEERTSLNLRLIHSGLSPATVKRAVRKLRDGELDGIICVDMLGEGFDLPELKIAAIHAPHRSLAATLQFIGRFARTGAEGTMGVAKFVAVPSEIEVERQKLFDETSTWQEIVTNLSEGKIQEEAEVQERLSEFERSGNSSPDLQDVSLHAFRPLKHFKIYRVFRSSEEIQINAQIDLPTNLGIVERWNDTSSDTTIFVTQERHRPEWTQIDEFQSVEYHLFTVYFDRQSNLLFINGSLRTMAIYEHIARAFTQGEHSNLPLNKVNNVLATLNNLRFSNIGMRRRALHPNADSYRISAGSDTQNAVSVTDGHMYDRGHVSCSGTNRRGDREYIGYSSASKVWSVENVLIPKLVQWAQTLAWRIENFENTVTGSGVDRLSTGTELRELPENIIAADWPQKAYISPPQLCVKSLGIETVLVDLELDVDRSPPQTNGSVRLILAGEAFRMHIDYTLLRTGAKFDPVEYKSEEVVIKSGPKEIPLVEYLREHPPPLFLADFSRVDGGQLFTAPDVVEQFDKQRIETIDWHSENVNIRLELYEEDSTGQALSIHEYLLRSLDASDAEIVFYDHGPGEMADVITIGETSDKVLISFHHCKKSSQPTPGSRTDDVYEVASQVVKSISWLRGQNTIFTQIKKRMRSRSGSCFVKGDQDVLNQIAERSQQVSMDYEMVLVQPGISQQKMKDNVANALASANNFIIESNCRQLRVWASP